MRIDKILVAMDFSPTARLALLYATALARKCGGRITLLSIVESPAMTPRFPAEALQLQRTHMDQAQRMLDALVGPEESNEFDIRTIVKSGDIAEEIVATATNEGMHLLVMGTHGRGIFGHSVIGSVTKTAMGRLEIPILTVRGLVRVPAFDRILFATDLSESSRRGLHLVWDLAQTTKSSVIALHAVDVGLEGGAEAAEYLSEPRLEEARAQLDEVKTEMPAQNFEVEAVLAEQSLARTIIRAAEEQQADVIAITVSTTGLVANEIIREADLPVLSIPVRAITTQEAPAA